MRKNILKYQKELSGTIKALRGVDIQNVVDAMILARRIGKRVFVFGNGGSAATAIHFANDLNKLAGIKKPERAIEAYALTNPAIVTALANDNDYSSIFSGQLLFAKDGDVAFGISCSGNSKNVVRALEIARSFLGMVTVLLTGDKPSLSSDIADCTVFVPSEDIRIQEDAHLAICHIIAGELRDRS